MNTEVYGARAGSARGIPRRARRFPDSVNGPRLAIVAAAIAASFAATGPARAAAKPESAGEQAPAVPPDPTVGSTAPSGDLAAAKGTPEADTPNDPTLPNENCLWRTICAVKEKIRWHTPAWKPETCIRVARGVLASARRHDIDPMLILGIMINESDMNDKAIRITSPSGGRLAKDSGLMAVRCIVDPKKNVCLNGNVRGMPWKDLMDPVANIEAGARELAYFRDGGAVSRRVMRVRDDSGHLRHVMKDVPCAHKTHGFWAHYNHGPRYIDTGFARHYPHRIAVLAHAMAQSMGVDDKDLSSMVVTMRDYGKPARRIDKPVETRHKKLYAQILETSGSCAPAVALAE